MSMLNDMNHSPIGYIPVDDWIFLKDYQEYGLEKAIIYYVKGDEEVKKGLEGNDEPVRIPQATFDATENYLKTLIEKYGVVKYTEYLKVDGKLAIIEFDKYLKGIGKQASGQDSDPDKIASIIANLNTFVVGRDAYVKKRKLEKICDYVNYFLTYYDDEKELIVNYYYMKVMVNKKTNELTKERFILLIYQVLFTPNLIKKIENMVEDNYYLDIEDNTKMYDPALEYRNVHAKLLMKIAIAMDILIPILMHYINAKQISKDANDGDDKIFYPFMQDTLYMFNDDIDIYRKLYLTVERKVRDAKKKNATIYDQKEGLGLAKGATHLNVIDDLLKGLIISDTIFKYTFKKRCIALNSVSLDRQLNYYNIEPYKKTPVELSHIAPSDNGLSGIDKMEINAKKLDESIIITASLNVPDTIKYIRKRIAIDIPREELDFYISKQKPIQFQKDILFNFFAKDFVGYRDLEALREEQYFTLLILLKRRLQACGQYYLPQLLTANFVGEKLKDRSIQNAKFLTKIRTDQDYIDLFDGKFRYIKEMGKIPDLLKPLCIMINNKGFTYVDYDVQETLGEHIEINQDVLSKEFLTLLKMY